MGDQDKDLGEATKETLSPSKLDHLPTDTIDRSVYNPPKSAPLADDEDLELTSDQPSIETVTSSKPPQVRTESPHTMDTTESENIDPFSEINSLEQHATAIAVDLQSIEPNGGIDVTSSPDIPTQESLTPVSNVITPSSATSSALETGTCESGDTHEKTTQEPIIQPPHAQSQMLTGTRIPQPTSTKTVVPAIKPTLKQADLPANQFDKNTKPANVIQDSIGDNQRESSAEQSAATITPNTKQQPTEQQQQQQQQMERKPDDVMRETFQPPPSRYPKPQNQSPITPPITPAKPPANQPTKTKSEANNPATPSDQTAHQETHQPLPSDKPAGDKTPDQKTSPTSKESSAESSMADFLLEKSESTSDITLFFFYNSYYSQRVLLCLFEREIAFKVRPLNTFADENLEPWYMALNPKAEVPMLKVGERYITESEVIINYLGRLPISKGTNLVGDIRTPSGQLIQRFRRLIDDVNMVLLSYGLIYHPQLSKGKINMPTFIQRLAKGRTPSKVTTLSQLAEKYPEHRNAYLALIETNAQRCGAFEDAEAVSKEIDHVGQILESLEEQLAKTKPVNEANEWWLCGEEFTAADISMIVLVHRLHLLGLNCDFLADQSLPLVQQYFKRASDRPSYKTLMTQSGTTATFKRLLIYSTKRVLPYVGGATVLGMAAGVAFWVYKSRMS